MQYNRSENQFLSFYIYRYLRHFNLHTYLLQESLICIFFYYIWHRKNDCYWLQNMHETFNQIVWFIVIFCYNYFVFSILFPKAGFIYFIDLDALYVSTTFNITIYSKLTKSCGVLYHRSHIKLTFRIDFVRSYRSLPNSRRPYSYYI